MYQVYSQQRPGRPRLAILATALLLLLTLGLAQAVIEYKSRIYLVPLSEPVVYADGGLRCRLPLGWEKKQVDELPPRMVAALVEKNPVDGQVRQLFLFRGLPRALGLPSHDAVVAIDRVIQTLVPGSKYQDYGFGRVGSLPGWTLASGPIAFVGAHRAAFCLGRAAIAPQGQILGAVLVSPGEMKRGDLELLDQVCQNLELLHVQPGDPEKVMAAAGIHFAEPEGATFFSISDSSAPRIQMHGGEDKNTWYLDAYCVPLVGSRKPADLVTDYSLALLSRTELPEPVKTTPMGNRNYAELRLSFSTEAKPFIIIGCAQTEEHTALLLIGRHEADSGKILREHIRAIARAAEVKPFGQRIDIASAQENARQFLKTIASDGLSRTSGSPPGKQEYVIQSAGLTWGREVREVVTTQRENALWWDTTIQVKIEVDDMLRYEVHEEWAIKDDGAQHRYDYRVSSRKIQAEYTERRQAGASEVRRRVVFLDADARLVSTPVSDTYGPEPILLRAAAKMAWDAELKPAIFNATEPFAQDSVYYLFVPMGRVKQPESREGSPLAAVQLLRDFDPAPITLYFDREQNLVASANDSGRWQILEGEALPADLVP